MKKAPNFCSLTIIRFVSSFICDLRSVAYTELTQGWWAVALKWLKKVEVGLPI